MARLILKFEPEVFVKDICEGYVKGFHTLNEFTELLYEVTKNVKQPKVEG